MPWKVYRTVSRRSIGQQTNDFRDRPNMVGNLGFHRGRSAKRLVNAGEVAIRQILDMQTSGAVQPWQVGDVLRGFIRQDSLSDKREP